jgi:hypothetical protein
MRLHSGGRAPVTWLLSRLLWQAHKTHTLAALSVNLPWLPQDTSKLRANGSMFDIVVSSLGRCSTMPLNRGVFLDSPRQHHQAEQQTCAHKHTRMARLTFTTRVTMVFMPNWVCAVHFAVALAMLQPGLCLKKRHQAAALAPHAWM